MTRRVAILYACVLLMTLAMTWVFLSMRAVMDIGGSCASGGPYEIATPCPSHVAALMTIGIPAMIVCALAGTAIAVGLDAPDLLLPMWWLLFGSLGWNFLEYGLFSGGVVWGWVVCGVLFEAMALPALVIQVTGYGGSTRLGLPPAVGTARWLAVYVVLAAAGLGLGWWSFDAWS